MHTVEGLMGKQTRVVNNTTPSSVALHKNSHSVSKAKPKIRIIHIRAPEIIKTDAANFRELVQRLTGKPTDEKSRKPRSSISASKRKRGGERIKGEEEEEQIWRSADTGGGFLGGFAELNSGFMQELNQLPFMEGTSRINLHGDQ